MEGLAATALFARMVGKALGQHKFTLLDVGCSSGIDPAWRIFGKSLCAFGFDPNIDEIERLSASETAAGVSYIPAFVGVPPMTPDADRLRSEQFWARNPWARLSAARTLDRRATAASMSNSEATALNLWHRARLANSEKPVILPSFCAERGIRDVDFVKIDVDGPDFLILRSLEGFFEECRVLGVGVEVNFFGSDDPDIHTFHNVDRLMRKAGFDLFFLSSRPFSVAALPARYQNVFPSTTEFGRPLQGDAIYLRDAASPENVAWSSVQKPEKLLKLAALYSLIRLPDCAAEILVNFREQLASIFDIETGLDVLTDAARADHMPTTHREYIAAFETDDPCFYSGPSTHERTAQDSALSADESSVLKGCADHWVRAESERLRAELRAIRESTSWKVTAPLRWVSRRARRFRRAVSRDRSSGAR
jgi:hypothetical protein